MQMVLFTVQENRCKYCVIFTVLGPVSTWMGNHLQTGKPSRYVTSHLGQLCLAIPPWVGEVSTTKTGE